MDFQIHLILKNLSKFFDSSLSKDSIQDSFNNTRKCDDEIDSDTESDDNYDTHTTNNFNNMQLIKKVKEDKKCSEILSELISTAFQTRETPGTFFCEQDSWEFLSKQINVKDYKNFINCLVLLCRLDYFDKDNRKLSILAGRSYMLMLTTPGAKTKNVFDEDLIIDCMKIFDCVQNLRQSVVNEKIPKADLVDLQMDLFSFLVELKTTLRHISLDEYVDTLKLIISTLTIIIRDNYINGYDSIYAFHMTMESYKVIELICSATCEDVDQILSFVVMGTCCLYFYTKPPEPKEDVVLPENIGFDGRITSFILSLLDKQPSHMISILERFIQTVVSNRDESLTDEEYNLFLGACTLYDLTMYKEFSSSILPYLEKAIFSKNSKIRYAVITLLNKMLNTPEMDNLSHLSRALVIMKIIMESMIDIDNNVKINAITSFLAMMKTGNDNCRIVFEMAIKKRDAMLEITDDENDVPDSAAEITQYQERNEKNSKPATITSIFPVQKTIDADIKIDALDSTFNQLLQTLLHLLNNTKPEIRVLVLEILELLMVKNHDIIEIYEVHNYVTALPVNEKVAKVKKQLIYLVNNIINQYPNSDAALRMYGEVIIELISDREKQIWQAAVESIKTNIFDCIKTYEFSGNVINIRPWLFFGVIFSSSFRHKFFERMDILIKQNVISQKVLSVVESHLSTSNSIEAWTVIYFLSKKVKSRNPEHVISAFKDIIINPEIVRSDVFDIVFQVMNTWVEDFAKSTLQKLQEMIRDVIHSCSSEAHVMSNLYNFANKAYKLCNNTLDFDWIINICENATSYIINNMNYFFEDEEMDPRFAQKLYIFSESSTDLPDRPDNRVSELLMLFLTRVESGEILTNNSNFEPKICISIIVLTRLALRDSGFALTLMAKFLNISNVSEKNYNITSNLANAYRDLIIKFGILMEQTLKPLALQIRFSFPKIRFQALSFLADIIMRDITKMTNFLLFQFFLGVVDDDNEISDLAKNIILSYVEHRNSSLLRECFLDTIFVIHNYLHFSQFTFSDASDVKRNETLFSWPENMPKRNVLYNFIIESMDIIEAYKIFEWTQILAVEAEKPGFKESSGAKSAMKDILYILRKLCFQLVFTEEMKTLSKKSSKDDESDENTCDDDFEKEFKDLIKNANPKESCEHIISTIPAFYEQVLLVFPDFEAHLNRVMEAIFICFQDMIPEALTFFSPYSSALKIKVKLSKERSCDGNVIAEKNDRLRLVIYIVRKEHDLFENVFYRKQIG